MASRVAKVESLIQQIVAAGMLEYVDRQAAAIVTVTRVDASPDLRHATIWLGVLGSEPVRQAAYVKVLEAKADLQRVVARRSTTKFVPHLTFKLDTGGEYAAEIDQLLRRL